MIAFKLAKREIKNNLKYWTFFSLNLFVGLLGFTFILMFRANVNANLELRAKTLLTSDMAITGRRALQGEEKTEVVNYLKDKVRTKASLIELYSMAKTLNGKKQSRTRLTNIKVINGHYPLVGKITLADGRTLNKELIEELRENTYVLISKEVSHQFKISLGDKLKLGKQIFEVYGILEEDSTSSMRGFNLAPKVYISLEHLKSTGLVSFGTVAWFSDFYLLNKGQDLDKLQTDLHKIITDPAIKVRLPKNSSEQIGRVLNYLSDYLGLIGVIALLISMVGASYLFQTYIFDRIRQIGILKAIGVAKGQILQSYSFIILFMGAIASLLALFISNYTLPFALDLLANWLKGSMQMIVPFEIVFVVLAVGIVINLLVCLPILNRVFRHQTNQLLADELQTKLLWADYLGYLPLLIFTWLLSVYQAHSFVIGSVFTFSLLSLFAIVLFVLPMLFKGINNWLKGRLISFPATISIGFALRVLTRNRMTSVLTILSLAMGISLMSVIGQLDASIKSELVTSEVEKPSLFLFDIQGDQYQELKKLKKKYDIPLLEPAPMIRGRLIKINGEETKRQLSDDGFRTREEETSERFNNRGVNLSYATGINSAEKIIQGRPFSGTYSGEGLVEISMEKRYAQRLGIKLGDKLVYEVMGVEIEGEVVNLRTVKWTSFLPNFFIVMQPGVLEDAPKTYVAAVKKVDFARQLEIQDIIVEALPNVSIINVTELIEKILVLFTAMAYAMSIMSICTIIVGMFVLYSILQSQMHKKQKDMALQKLTGMDEKLVFKTIYNEFLLMALLAMLVGNLVGPSISIIVSVMFLDGVFVFNWPFFLFFNSCLLLIVSVIIYLSYRNNFKRKINELLLA